MKMPFYIFARKKRKLSKKRAERYPFLQILAHKLREIFAIFAKIFRANAIVKISFLLYSNLAAVYLSVPDVHADAAGGSGGPGAGGLMVGGWRRTGRHQGRQLRTHQVRQVSQVARVHLRHQL